MGLIAFLDLGSCSLKLKSLPDPVVLSPCVKSLWTSPRPQQSRSWREAGFGFPRFFLFPHFLLVPPASGAAGIQGSCGDSAEKAFVPYRCVLCC